MSYIHRLLFIALAGCGGASAAGPDGPVVDGAPADALSGHRTVDTCATQVAAGAPAFYARFFRCVTITTTATGVAIATQDLPPHPSNYWSTDDPDHVAFDTSRGAAYHANPNLIAAQTIAIAVPTTPAAGGGAVQDAEVDLMAHTSGREYALGPIGVALDGTALYAGFAAPGDDLAAEAYTFDDFDGHPDQRGAYHYHSATPGPLEALRAEGVITHATPGAAEVELYGVLCDGTIVLGCTELDGGAPVGALDAQGGHVGDVEDAAGTMYFAARYHVHVCTSAAKGHLYTPEVHYYAAC
jgi:hypothetical protein